MEHDWLCFPSNRSFRADILKWEVLPWMENGAVNRQLFPQLDKLECAQLIS